MVKRLSRTSHHNARACLIACFFQPLQTFQPVFARHRFGVQHAVMGGVVCFMAQQIAVGSCAEQSFVFLSLHLAQRERDGAVGICAPDGAHHILPHVIAALLLASLQYESTKPQLVPLPAGVQDFVLSQFVARHQCVGSPDAAIQAVVATAVAHLYQSAYVYVIAKLPLSHLSRLPVQIVHSLGIRRCEQPPVCFGGESVLASQPVNPCLHMSLFPCPVLSRTCAFLPSARCARRAR